jgi:hypothetical protein
MIDNLELFKVDDSTINRKKQIEESHLLEQSQNVDNTNDIAYDDFNKEKEYDFGYRIILNYPGEEGFIEDYINEMNSEDKKKDPNDMFNFGLNPDKWIKLLNKSILMHYERHVITTLENKNK